jgi:trimeric autotransporter adhesin
MRLLLAVLLTLAVSSVASGQTYTISTFAGGALPVDISGTSASLSPEYVAADPAGNLFFVDHNTVLRLDATSGILTRVAGNGTTGFSGDNGPAASAQLYFPTGVAVDSAGNLYIADTDNNRIRKVSNGVIATVAGNGLAGFSGDNGAATSARLASPQGVTVDSAGNLYIADAANNRIRKVSNGVIATVAGNGLAGFSGDNGPAISARLGTPIGIAVDLAGNLYIADRDNNRIRKVASGVIATAAGNGTEGFSGDNGPAANAQLSVPICVAVDSPGNLYIADSYNNRIRKVTNGAIATVAGGGTPIGGNGPALSWQFRDPSGVAVDSAGNLYITDEASNRIWKVSNGLIAVVAGNGTSGFSGDNGPATSAQLDKPIGAAVDSAGNLYPELEQSVNTGRPLAGFKQDPRTQSRSGLGLDRIWPMRSRRLSL